PLRTSGLALSEILFDPLPLVGAQHPFRIGGTEWPCRHQDPPKEGEQMRHDQEDQDAARHRCVQLLDAVPFVAGRLSTADGIDFLYVHGLSSLSRMSFLALSNRFLFEGQKV